MTIKTLKTIHKLLADETWKAEQIYRSSRNLQHEYEDSENPDKELINNQKEFADRFYNQYAELRSALEDFEQQEW